MLEQFRKAKEAEIAHLVALEARGLLPQPRAGQRPSFVAGLKARYVPVIAEYKRASPSTGAINLEAEPEKVAAGYAKAGAGAISVLTEQTHFKGNMEFLDNMAGVGLPLLRKDFILHPLQIAQTAASPASAFLLIVRMVDDALLGRLLESGRNHGLEAVVEVFDATDLRRARQAGATIIQVNNRDLDTLKLDMSASRTLISGKKNEEFWITASGIADAGILASLLSLGFDAALIGSFLMGEQNPGQRLAALIQGVGNV